MPALYGMALCQLMHAAPATILKVLPVGPACRAGWSVERMSPMRARWNDDSVVILTELAGGDPESADLHLFIVGALGQHGCEMVQAQLLGLARTCQRMTVDLSEVSVLGAAGFRLLVLLHQTLSEGGGQLVLVEPSSAARKVLDILHWDDVRKAVTPFHAS